MKPGIYYPVRTPLAPTLDIVKCSVEQWQDSKWSRRGGLRAKNYGIDYVLSGCGRFRSADTSWVRYGPGSVFFFPAGGWFCYDPLPGETLTHLWVRFTGRAADSATAALYTGRNLVAGSAETRKLRPQFETILRECLTGTEPASLRVTGLVFNLLIQVLVLVRDTRAGCSHENRDACQRFIEFAQGHAKEAKLNIDSFLQMESLGYESFRKRFKAYAGVFPYTYWLQCKVNLARNRLETTDTSIGEIAYELGFRDVYYFSRFFKKRTGCTPTQYRTQHQFVSI